LHRVKERFFIGERKYWEGGGLKKAQHIGHEGWEAEKIRRLE